MDRRGWLWKKRSSDKNIKVENEKPVSTSEFVGPTLFSVAHVGDQVFVRFFLLLGLLFIFRSAIFFSFSFADRKIVP